MGDRISRCHLDQFAVRKSKDENYNRFHVVECPQSIVLTRKDQQVSQGKPSIDLFSINIVLHSIQRTKLTLITDII